MTRIGWKIFFSSALIIGLTISVQAQNATYRLHREASTTTGLLQLKTANPDAASLAVLSANLKSVAVGEYIIKAFDTQSGVPAAAGIVPSGSAVSFTLWMRKTATSGTIFPRAKLRLNSATGTSLCTATGATALSTTLTKYTLSCTTAANVSMTATDRFYLWVGANVTAAPTVNTNAELDIEGTLNGNYDSLIQVPLPVPPPSIASLSPTSGSVATSVTITGSNFGATQGASAVSFNGTNATPGSWSATSINAPVPNGATTGPVVVTVNGAASNGVAFTVVTNGTLAGTITRTSDGAALVGALVEAIQSGVIKASATTLAGGGYSMPNLPAGTYDVRASAIGYLTKMQAGVVVNSGATTTFNQNLVADTNTTINYVYDELGRLVSVVGAAETVSYNYDAVGNLLSIARRNTNLPSILEFTPNGGAVGASVTIYGTGFSATANQNTVKFNGTTATVISATTTQITTTVPAGATTGLISVATPIGTATSSAPFNIGTSNAPTITSFSPTIATSGTAVNITGTNFETVPANNKLKFNISFAAVGTSTATTITSTVPSATTSGRLKVSTPAGTATSSADFFVPPSPYAAADVSFTDRMAIGDSRSVTLGTANKIALIVFDGTAGQRVSLNVTSSTITGSVVSIINSNGQTLASVNANTSGGFTDTPQLPSTGTYTILVDPDTTYTGTLSFTLYNATDLTGTITLGGAPVTVTTSAPGQNAQLTFNGTAGQRVSLNVGGVTIPGTTNISIKNLNGTILVTAGVGSSGALIESPYLPSTGAYTVLVDPSVANTGSATLTLYDASDVTGAITPGGSPVTATTNTPGQNAKLTFNGATGQRVSLKLTGVAITGGSRNWVDVSIKKPDGTNLTSSTFDNAGGFLDVQTLTVAGTYSVFIDPWDTSTGSVTSTLYDVPVDATGTITPGGAASSVTTTIPGQNGQITFSGAAGQRVSLKVAGVTLTGGSRNWVNVAIKRPDGTTLASDTYDASGGFIDVQTLAVAGTYTILFDPWDTSTGGGTLTLYDVPADFTSGITPGGSSVTATTGTAGQNMLLTFNGTAGQRVSLRTTGVSLTGGARNWVNVAIKRPDGTTLASDTYDAGGGFIDVQTLAVAGTYTILFDPWDTSTGSLTATLYDVPADASGSVIIGGAAASVSTSVLGQNAQVTFDGTTGQQATVHLTNNTMSVVTVTLRKPDGTSLTSTVSSSSSFNLTTQTLPTTGTYTIFIDPNGINTGGISVSVTNP